MKLLDIVIVNVAQYFMPAVNHIVIVLHAVEKQHPPRLPIDYKLTFL